MEAIIFRSITDGFLYYSLNGTIEPLDIFQDNVFKLPAGSTIGKNNTEYKISPIQTTDGIPTYKLELPPVVVRGGGGRGPQGPQGASGSGNPIYGQAYSKTGQTVAQNNAVVWDNIQNGLGVTLSTSKDIQVSLAGVYQVDWIVEIKTIYSPS